MRMDYQTTYNGSMAKLAEAQKCQNEIIRCNNELQQVNNVMNTTSNPQYYYLLKEQRGKLVYQIDKQTKDRNKKLNEALSKALDLVDDETDKGIFNSDSFGGQAMGAIYTYADTHNIQCPYSAEVNSKFAKLMNKGINDLKQFLNQQRLPGDLWI